MPLVLLATLTLLCYWTPLDLAVTRQFFSTQGERFPYTETFLANTIYDYGPIPAVVFGVGSVAAWIGSFLFTRLRSVRKGALFCSLAILIGPGILINTVLKPNWGRPRPCDTVVFGGQYEYIPPGTIGPYEMAKSFPSGHASMGFVFLLPAFLLLRKNPKAAMCVFAVGFMCGAGVGASRIAEGGHYLSDIAWSGAIVYFTGLTLYVGMYGWKQPDQSAPSTAETLPFSLESQTDNVENVRKSSAA
ncbi:MULTISPECIES: phosphatase PAP2 family protein [Pirellulaceae]|uniref:phosphatase PAP2 family protein n=1 Tax=Pirellulaceae TaxID=2691357 RepID=UPI001304E16E|nr:MULTISPECIES: phosphatase PAP2 family protein [Pirellulaceae]